jgi:signal peptidase I
MRIHAKEVLRRAKHLRNTREDIMPADALEELNAAMGKLAGARKAGAVPAMEAASKAVLEVVNRLTPKAWRSSFRENVDVIFVAVAVAMAFRAYFFQPFKIPTGSMQPTLYGVHTEQVAEPTAWDRLPLSLLRTVSTGTMFRRYTAKASGSIGEYTDTKNPSKVKVRIGGKLQKLPKGARADGQLPPTGGHVKRGDLLWQGRVSLGDHLFVNKLAWNFRLPRRGEIMVFETDGIEGLTPHTHYIKRMCGLPNEVVTIDYPNLIVNGEVVTEPEGIARLARKEGLYLGYSGPRRRRKMEPRELGPDQYAAFGDNTNSSYDSRYWGAVPRGNLVGPAAFVYWPVTKRWGRTD